MMSSSCRHKSLVLSVQFHTGLRRQRFRGVRSSTTPITLLRCREQAGERFRTTQTSSPPPAGRGNCLRTVKLLAPGFSGASRRATVGKLLEAAAGRHLTRSGQRTACGMHWTQAIMLGKQNDPRGLTEELEQFLYILNLLDCSTAASVSRVCSRAPSVSSPPRSGGAAASSSHNLGSSPCRHRGRRNTHQSWQTSHRCIGQGFRELVRTAMKARIANIAEPGVTTGGSADATGLFN